ncbi:helix-turn-helix domain-containing protein [Roseospira marina]|uniref:Helix-turn-helix domain-containing protein n=1 Tax=Roseospira marina TaxID=140057 RepID=A0A5M6I8C8_9PROT|nr:helix-turn-helix domain-containing protein [Roseospira marina]KAA5604177.1 helix-turn-helix domain-containing protein [Roseospira marina]MBB4315729.1 hypothetical protein [Roseospira marina]MBB5088841.1 hypothetical protein [Roseospira marina]
MNDSCPLPGWPRLMRRKTVAAYLDVSPGTVDTLDLPSHRIRSMRYWLRDEVDSWIDSQTGHIREMDTTAYLEQWG